MRYATGQVLVYIAMEAESAMMVLLAITAKAKRLVLSVVEDE